MRSLPDTPPTNAADRVRAKETVRRAAATARARHRRAPEPSDPSHHSDAPFSQALDQLEDERRVLRRHREVRHSRAARVRRRIAKPAAALAREGPPHPAGRPTASGMEDYEFLARQGAGSYAVVWKARDLRTGELVAVKELKEKYARCARVSLGMREADGEPRVGHESGCDE